MRRKKKMDGIVFGIVVAAVGLLATYVIRVINRYEYAPTLSRDFAKWYKEEMREIPQYSMRNAVMDYLEDQDFGTLYNEAKHNSGSLEEGNN